MSGATADTPLNDAMRSDCSIKSTLRLPPPTVPVALAPGDMVRRLVPRELILPTILSVAHCPIARSTTTEKTPIIIPSDESHALSLFASMFLIAVFAVQMRFIVQME
jgi:hypothetical protein